MTSWVRHLASAWDGQPEQKHVWTMGDSRMTLWVEKSGTSCSGISFTPLLKGAEGPTGLAPTAQGLPKIYHIWMEQGQQTRWRI